MEVEDLQIWEVDVFAQRGGWRYTVSIQAGIVEVIGQVLQILEIVADERLSVNEQALFCRCDAPIRDIPRAHIQARDGKTDRAGEFTNPRV